jgi:hypothetical protein
LILESVVTGIGPELGGKFFGGRAMVGRDSGFCEKALSKLKKFTIKIKATKKINL